MGVGWQVGAFSTGDGQGAEDAAISHGKAGGFLLKMHMADVSLRHKAEPHAVHAEPDAGLRISCADGDPGADAIGFEQFQGELSRGLVRKMKDKFL